MITSIILILLGTGFIICAVFNFARSSFLNKNGIKVNATVVGYEVEDTREPWWSDYVGGLHHYVTFSYIIDGTEYKTRYNTDCVDEEPKYLIDETVRIYCNKNKPDKFVISKDKDRASSSAIGLVLGVIFITVGIYIILR